MYWLDLFRSLLPFSTKMFGSGQRWKIQWGERISPINYKIWTSPGRSMWRPVISKFSLWQYYIPLPWIITNEATKEIPKTVICDLRLTITLRVMCTTGMRDKVARNLRPLLKTGFQPFSSFLHISLISHPIWPILEATVSYFWALQAYNKKLQVIGG